MVTFEDYKQTFGGDIIETEEEFDSAKKRAVDLLFVFTSGRINDFNGQGKISAVCAIAEAVYSAIKQAKSNLEHTGISSENTDGYSVSYVNSGTDALSCVYTKEFNRRAYDIALIHLPDELFNRSYL